MIKEKLAMIKSDRFNHQISQFAIFLLFTSLLHHMLFCFINTHVKQITTAPLVLTELSMIGVVFLFFLRKINLGSLILILFVIANTLVLVIFQSYFDPKEIRNFINPILLLWLGTQYNNTISTDRLVKWFGLIVLTVALFELAFSDLYQQIFNVLQFQIALGRSTEEALKFVTSNLSLNGVRWSGRNFLAFLGDHRISSVFLETVNVGNFSVLVAAWGLSKNSFKQGMLYISIGLFIGLLADSRFAVTLISGLILLRYCLPINMLKLIGYFMPVFMLAICFLIAEDQRVLSDDFKGRLGSTGYFILHFKPQEFFGLYNRHYTLFVDQGYAHILHFNGALLCLIMWVSLCWIKMQSDVGIRFKALISILIAASLAISGDSVFAFKWSALMWFLLGTLALHAYKKNTTTHAVEVSHA